MKGEFGWITKNGLFLCAVQLTERVYFFDKDKNIIAKGLSSIKYMSSGIAEELYGLAHEKSHRRFVDILRDLDQKTSLNTRQLDILMPEDFIV